MAKRNYVLGYDIGGTKIAICLAVCNEKDNLGCMVPVRIIGSVRIPGGSKQGPETAIQQMLEVGDDLLADNGLTRSDLTSVGICVPGTPDFKNGIILLSPNMPLWDNVKIVDEFKTHFRVPVHFENDANGAVLAEVMFGTAMGRKNVVYLTMSTGVGSGVVVNGQLLTGHSGKAGEMGHIILDINGPQCGCGMKGCFEAFCGGKRFEERVRKVVATLPNHHFLDLPDVDGKIENINLKVVRDAALAGDAEAYGYWDEFCLRLAQGIGVCQMTFNPEIIVLGTIAIHSGESLLAPVRRYLPQFSWRGMINDCEIKPSILGSQIGELSGVAVALYTYQ